MQLGMFSPSLDGGPTAILRRRKVGFDDVIGCEVAKSEFKDVVDFLKDPGLYAKHGATVPRGILLDGPPGTGKTMLARAAATEAGAYFIHMTGSDFREAFVGTGPKKVRRMFSKARKRAPAVIFIDEFETLGRARSASSDGDHNASVNALLAEMDGFVSSEGVLVIAATNHADQIDDALKRPGRFDRHIYVGLPDVKGRRDMLIHYLAKKESVADDVSIGQLAKTTAGFSGAQIAGLVNEAAIMAAKEDAHQIRMAHFVDARDRLLIGQKNTHRLISEAEREIVAAHEAGHALAAWMLDRSAVELITIMSRGKAGGYTMIAQDEERSLITKRQMEEKIIILMAGRAAEELFFGSDGVSGGASDDISRAVGVARYYVAQAGLGDEGVLCVSGQSGDSEDVKQRIEKAVEALIARCKAQATAILQENQPKLARLRDELLASETLSKADLEALLQ